MFRSTLIATGAALLCSSAYAQQQLDPSRIHPITVPVRDAGVFNWDTKTWVSGPKANKLTAAAYTVWNNTCTWTGGAYYYGGFEHCEELVESGRLPATDTPFSSLEGNPTGLTGVLDSQIINSFQFGYCTNFATGTVDWTVGFYDTLRGDCVSGIPVRGRANATSPYQTLSQQAVPFGTATAYFDFGTISGNPLPGATTAGQFACWSVTLTFANNGGFCMQSEGDGSWDNSPTTDDMFSWSLSHDMVNSLFAGDNGPFISGEPLVGGYGSGAYNLPAVPDPLQGNAPCGTGFGASADGWWINVAGSAPGVRNTLSPAAPTPATHKAECALAAPAGTNCYWFGGWPGNPLGSFWLVLGSTGDCSGCNNRAFNYCTSGTSFSGCNAQISAQGQSSATAATGFFLTATGIEGNKDGIFYFGLTQKSPATTVGNSSSYQCVNPPVKRTGLLAGVGTNGQCDGFAQVDLNARYTAKPSSNPGAGATQFAQLWYRDPLNTSNQTTSRSGAVGWTVCP
jgi:hypothetical protein